MNNGFLLIITSLLSGSFGVIITLLVNWQLQKKKAKKAEQMTVFKTLTENRFMGVSYEQTRALNSIDVVFYGVDSVIDAWKTLYEYYLNPSITGDKSDDDKMANLLLQMAKHLGYENLDFIAMKKSYLPKGISDSWHKNVEFQQLQLELFKRIPDLFPHGTTSIPHEKI